MSVPGKACPYIRLNSKDRNTICTGTKHLRTNLPTIPCPLWVEASQWSKHVGIRGPFDLESFDSNFQPDAYAAVSEWVRDPRGLILLSSLPGRGKSHLVLGAWYALRRRFQPCLFTSSVLFQQLSHQASMGEDRGAMSKFVGENLLTCSSSYFEEAMAAKPDEVPVIFDDLGAERTTDTLLDYFERMLNYHDSMILTTNLDLEQIASRYKERITSRLLQATHVLWLEGEDWRARSGGEDSCE